MTKTIKGLRNLPTSSVFRTPSFVVRALPASPVILAQYPIPLPSILSSLSLFFFFLHSWDLWNVMYPAILPCTCPISSTWEVCLQFLHLNLLLCLNFCLFNLNLHLHFSFDPKPLTPVSLPFSASTNFFRFHLYFHSYSRLRSPLNYSLKLKIPFSSNDSNSSSRPLDESRVTTRAI